jgi:hypothetical protein
MRNAIGLICLLAMVGPAAAEPPPQAEARECRLVCERMERGNPTAGFVCEELLRPQSNCTNPCANWARLQPDFRFSLEACTAKCEAEFPCDRRP